MDLDQLWAEATDLERGVIVGELLESVAMYPDHLEVTVSGVPKLNVTLEEVGLTGGWQFFGVGGATVLTLPGQGTRARCGPGARGSEARRRSVPR